jgi:hypothetical protein
MTIVMGLDQHRAQITTEWIDTLTGEIGRARVSPAHREGVRRFLTGTCAPTRRHARSVIGNLPHATQASCLLTTADGRVVTVTGVACASPV